VLQRGVVAGQGGPPPSMTSTPAPVAVGVAGAVVPIAKSSRMATASLVLAIGSWIPCTCVALGPLASLPGFILGLVARGKIKRSHGTLTGGGRAAAGWIISLINLLLMGGTILAFVFVPSLRNAAVSAVRVGMVGQTCIMYSNMHGQMPPDLQTLVDDGLVPSAEWLTCPMSDEQYVFTAADKSLGDLYPGMVILYSRARMMGGRHLVMVWGGRIEGVAADDLRGRLRGQGTPEHLLP
jgi:hypothetical protein